MVWGFHFCLVLWGAVVIDGDMVGVGVVCLVGHSWYDAEGFAVFLGEFSG